jgi:hypothetical protein
VHETPRNRPPLLDEVLVVQPDLVQYGLLREGKVIPGRFPSSIRIDQATHLHGNADPHAHVFGRQGDELGVVNLDGTGSHGSKFKLHDKDADALRSQDFKIRPDNLVEWIVIEGIGSARQLLLA